MPGRETSVELASSSADAILIGDSLESQLEHEREIRQCNQARADSAKRTMDELNGNRLTIDERVEEERIILAEIQASQTLEAQQLAEYEAELETQERLQREEDEDKWQTFLAAKSQEEDECALREAMEATPKRMRTTLMVELKGKQGQTLGSFGTSFTVPRVKLSPSSSVCARVRTRNRWRRRRT